MKTRFLPLIFLFVVVVFATTVQARIQGDYLKVTCNESLSSVFPNGEMSLSVAFNAEGPVSLEKIHFQGNGWIVKASDIPSRLTMGKGQKNEFTISAVAGESADPLVLHWLQDGKDRQVKVGAGAGSGQAVEAGLHLPPGSPQVAALARKFEAPERNPDPFLVKKMLREIQDGDLELKEPEGDRRSVLMTGRIVFEDDDGQLVPAKNILVIISESIWPNIITNTDMDGNFSINASISGEPNMHVWAFAANTKVEVEEFTLTEGTWNFTGPSETIEGSSHDFGTVMPSGTQTRQAFMIANTIQTGAEFYADRFDISMPHVEVLWSDDYGGSYFNFVFEEVHLAPHDGWKEGTILHEYGHFWANNNTAIPDFAYCNDTCDDGFGYLTIWDCGHCMWCEENAGIAYSEGLAHFFSRLVTDDMKRNSPVPNTINEKRIHVLGTDPTEECGQNPQRTEGFFAAFIYDIADELNEDDPRTPGFRDELSGRADEVFEALVQYRPEYGGQPDTPWEVITVLLEVLDEDRSALWATARNNNFEIDLENPGIVSGFTSSPAVNVLTPDATVDISWNVPDDDVSGIAGYSLCWSMGQVVEPDSVEIEVTTAHVLSSPLVPGNWYLSVRAMDRAGHWATQYSSTGPFVIREADPVNLEPVYYPNWQWPLVLSSELTSPDDVSVSEHLIGRGETYWNFAMVNSGESTPDSSTTTDLFIDGKQVASKESGIQAPAIGQLFRNLEPVSVMGGRHMARILLDKNGSVAESDENDNYWAGQWVWTPQTLTTEPSSLHFMAPANWLADFQYFNWEQPFGPNCDGHRIPWQPSFHGVFVYTFGGDTMPDFDIRLHEAVNFSDDGFRDFLAESARGPGAMDALIINPANAGYVDHNLGVICRGESRSRYVTELIGTEYIGSNWGDYDLELRGGHMGKIFTFFANAESAGRISVRVETDPPDVPVGISYLSPDFSVGGILDADEVAVSSGDDPATLNIHQDTGTMGAFMIWRETSSYYLYYPVDVKVSIYRTLPDLVPHTPEGWDFPLIPDDDLTLPPYDEMHAPTELHAGQSTWFYGSQKNNSSVPVSLPSASILIDGAAAITGQPAGIINPGSEIDSLEVINSRTSLPVVMPGGRHTLTFVSDSTDQLTEENESNNRFAQQWIWEPLIQGVDGLSVAYPYVPDYLGGFEDLAEDSENPTPFNCLGVRVPGFNPLHTHKYMSICMVPEEEKEIMMGLYLRSTGPRDGFNGVLSDRAFTNQHNESKFILVDLDQIGILNGYDVGLSSRDGASECLLQVEGSEILAGHHGIYGPNTLGPSDLINVHEKNFQPGLYHVRLVPDDPAVDLGLSLHMFQEEEFSDRDFVEGTTSSWEATDGLESFYVEVTEDMTCALAVWRRNQSALTTEVNYTIYIGPDISSVEDEQGNIPAATRLAGAAPNPFNPQTTINFELAREEFVKLTVFDLRGTPVRTLLEGTQAAGYRQVTWDGHDDFGRGLASGTYFIQMKTRQHRDLMKVMLIK